MPKVAAGTRNTFAALLLSFAAVAGVLGLGSPAMAQQDESETKGKGDGEREGEGDGYVELFDPDRDDAKAPPAQPVPEFRLEADDYLEETAREEAPKSAEDLFPWDPEPQHVPDRLLPPGDLRDPRSVALFSHGCADELHRRDVTLFANGTLRLRSGPVEEPQMQLEEIGPVELRHHLNQLLRIRSSTDFPDQLPLRGGVEGRWVGTCRFALDLPGFVPIELQVSAFDALPLELRQLELLADELAGLTRPLVRPEALPPDYEPQIGDVLRSFEGKIFRVLGRTSDGGALELQSLDGNWKIYVPEAEFPDVFAALELDLISAGVRAANPR